MQPNNNATPKNPVGRFMVATGAVIELKNTGKILINRRASGLDWQPNVWELVYGRLDQFEDLESGLKREVKEETGIDDLQIIRVLTTWHIFRGSKKIAQNELIGITFYCKTDKEKIILSDEHDSFKFIYPKEALKIIKIDTIRKDVEKFVSFKKHTKNSKIKNQSENLKK